MDSILEEKRSLHEERDRVELAIVNEVLSKKNGHKDKLDSEHRQKSLLDRYMKRSETLLDLYANKTPPIDLEPKTSASAFVDFYIALRKIKDFYSVHANEQVVTLANEFEEIEVARQIAQGAKANNARLLPSEGGGSRHKNQNNDQHNDDDDVEQSKHSEGNEEEMKRIGEMARLAIGMPTTDLVDVVEPTPVAAPLDVKSEKLVEFTDEEGYGRYLDLNKCHELYLQVMKRDAVKTNYLTFLSNFDRFSSLDRERKLTSAYKTYVEEMLNYFRSYSGRAKPLFDYQEMESRVEEKFLKQWNTRTLPGWFRESDRLQVCAGSMIELESYSSHEQLAELGLDCLKNELQVRGLKCGGTLEERAKRLWSIRGKQADEIDESLKAGSISVASKKGKRKAPIEAKYIASIEAKLSMYADYFNEHRQATIENVQRKQARTADERNESDEDISDVEEEDSDHDDVIYNPKNLPLGWDGKPIPYWLYKLHGLNMTFTCEICGNATYKGPKTFQRHFAEWRHAHGMRCLGIPNTAHFANITKIQDAINLWDRLKSERQKDKFQPLVEEEYEDSQGNVVNKKTYEDLKRQGLL